MRWHEEFCRTLMNTKTEHFKEKRTHILSRVLFSYLFLVDHRNFIPCSIIRRKLVVEIFVNDLELRAAIDIDHLQFVIDFNFGRSVVIFDDHYVVVGDLDVIYVTHHLNLSFIHTNIRCVGIFRKHQGHTGEDQRHNHGGDDGFHFFFLLSFWGDLEAVVVVAVAIVEDDAAVSVFRLVLSILPDARLHLIAIWIGFVVVYLAIAHSIFIYTNHLVTSEGEGLLGRRNLRYCPCIPVAEHTDCDSHSNFRNNIVVGVFKDVVYETSSTHCFFLCCFVELWIYYIKIFKFVNLIQT